MTTFNAQSQKRSFMTPLTKKRLALFKANRRSLYSFWIFMVLFVVSLFSEVIANDKPLLIRYQGEFYVPIVSFYTERTFGGDLEIRAEYRDSYVQALIEREGWMIWPPLRYSYNTIDYLEEHPSPAPPSLRHIFGTDDQARDILARLIYGFRLSVLFGLALTFFSSVIGVFLGAVQGYWGGRLDLYLQRFIEIWSSLPILYILIILSSIMTPNAIWLLLILLMFSWSNLVGVVRAECLRVRNLDYVRAAHALGVVKMTILRRHILPNALVATLTFLPFVLNGAITTLTALDFLGFGLPAGSPSLGDLLATGKANLQAPWIGLTAFIVLALMLSLLIFIGEGVRDAFDPRKTLQSETK